VKPSEFAHAARTTGSGETLEIVLAGRGGFAARLVPAVK
jgi:hypothetical protein